MSKIKSVDECKRHIDVNCLHNTYASISLVAFRLNGIRDGCELNSTSSLFDVCAIHSGHFHVIPFGCGAIIDVNVIGGCCNDIDEFVVTIVVNGDCFGELCKTDGLLSKKKIERKLDRRYKYRFTHPILFIGTYKNEFNELK